MPLLCMVLQDSTGTWYLVATSPHAEGAGLQGQARRAVLPFDLDLYCTGTDQRGIFSMNTTVLLWSVAKKEKTGGGAEILLLRFESSSVVAFPLQHLQRR